MDIFDQIYAQARRLGACDIMQKTPHTLEAFSRLMYTPQGREFCIKKGFPTLYTLRQFDREDLQGFGIYVDAGNITLQDPERCVVCGRTTATINLNDDCSHLIIVMHGAKLIINARGWSVANVEAQKNSQIIKNISEHSLIVV